MLFYEISFLQVHRLVVVDPNDTVIGVLSLSDILTFMVLRPFQDE